MKQNETKRLLRRAAAERQTGFTLIEIMIVIVIIGMLATGVTVGYMSQLKRSRMDTARNEACAIRNAVMMYIMQNPGKCPTVDDLKAGAYLDTKMRTTDPWGNAYSIECDDESPDVFSGGPEGNERIACEAKSEE